MNPPPPKKQEKLVRVTFNFVELSKDYNKLFGFKWQPGFTADPQITVGSGSANGASACGFVVHCGDFESLSAFADGARSRIRANSADGHRDRPQRSAC